MKRPRHRDNYIDKRIMREGEEPPVDKMRKHVEKAVRVKDMRRNLDSEKGLLGELQLPSLSPFVDYHGKAQCHCGRGIRFYCLRCMFSNPGLPFPQIKLPCYTVVLHHPEEKASKSSALPLVFLSKYVKRLDYKYDMTEELKDYDIDSTYILYPHKYGIKVDQLDKIPQRVIAIDCTWYQTNTVLRHLEMSKKFRYIKLDSYETHFWRYNRHSETALSSAEALYYFYREIAEKFENGGYKGQYDGLLYLFRLNYQIIEKYHYEKGKEGGEKNYDGDDQAKKEAAEE